MKDLTRGSIVSHILSMAPPIVVGMITIMICQLVDLYFVSGLGEAAIAGVAAAGNAGFLVNALMQVLGVGTVALMAHAVGRKDRGDANLVFNQSVVLSVLFGILTLVAGFALSRPYMRAVAADEATVEAGTVYLLWFMPALALQFATQVMASALRATGIVRPSMLVQALAVVINIALAPVLITGWGTGHALGVAGAGLASSIAVFVGVLMLLGYFLKLERYVAFHPEQWRPQLRQWKRILNVGLPAGEEFAMIFIIMAVGYYVLSIFGPAAQAGFGIGTRLLGLIQMPALAIALAAGPIAGQNFGAGNGARVRGDLCQGVAYRDRRDDCLHDPRAVRTRSVACRLLEGSGDDGGCVAVPAPRLAQHGGAGADLYLLQHVSGAWQHQAGVVDLGDAGSHLFPAVDLALDVAGLPDGACLVFVDRDDHATGRPERVAVAPGVQKASCAAGTGEGREAGKSRAGCASHARARVADRTDARLSPTHGSG